MGEFVAPDSAEAVTQGMKRLCEIVQGGRQSGDADRLFAKAWETYRAFACWNVNAEIVSRLIENLRAERTEPAIRPKEPLYSKSETEAER